MTDLNKRMRATGVKHWPYGINTAAAQTAMLDWAEANGLRLSRSGRCLHWLGTGRCAQGEQCTENNSTYRWMDHLTGWTRSKSPAVLVAHAYGFDSDQRSDLEAVAARYHLGLHVTEHGWYGHDTTMIELHATSATRSALLATIKAPHASVERRLVHERQLELGRVVPGAGELSLVYRTTNLNRDTEDCYLVQDHGTTSSQIYLGRLLPHDPADLRAVLDNIAARAERLLHEGRVNRQESEP